MFGIKRWVRQIADTAVADARAKIDADNAAAPPFNVDGMLDDGCILLFAREKKLLSPVEWKAKAVEWRKEYDLEPGWYSVWEKGTFFVAARNDTPIALAVRRAILEADVEIAEQAKKDAAKALAAAKKVANA